MSVVIRRASDRYAERERGRLTQHGFSFGAAYDPDWLAFGPMVCHDDHLLGAGRGFEEHPHSGLEIVTWVVAGAVRHHDSLGDVTELPADTCGVLSAGRGVRHSELAADAGSARFVQVWLRPDDPDLPPSYSSAAPGPLAPGAGLVPVAGAGTPLPVGVAGASFAVARLGAGETLTLPPAPKVHAYLATGALLRSSLAQPLQAGDAFCCTDAPAYDVTASVPTDLLVWSFGG